MCSKIFSDTNVDFISILFTFLCYTEKNVYIYKFKSINETLKHVYNEYVFCDFDAASVGCVERRIMIDE